MDEPNVRSCGSFHRGHNVHVIQWKLSRQAPGRAGQARMLANGWVEVRFDDRTVELWSHGEARLTRLIEEHEGRVILRDRGVLASRGGFGTLVSVSAAASSCIEARPPEPSRTRSPMI